MRSPDAPITAPAALLGLSAAALLLLLSVAATGGVAQVLPDAAGGVPGVREAPWGGWAAETVQGGGDPVSLELDSQGQPVIGYSRDVASGWPGVSISQRSGPASWSHESVASPVDFLDFTLGSQDRAHLVYENFTNYPETFDSNITYAVEQADGSWDREKVSGRGSHTSKIALTQTGEPRITIGHQLTLRYLEPTADGWSSTKVAEDGFWHDLALDSNDNPHLAFGRPDNTGGKLGYATQLPNGSWHVNKTVLDGCGQAISIATGPNDRPHIACHLVNGNGLEYVWQDAAGVWHHETADDGSGPPFDRASSQVGWSTDIAVDDEGEPHISYRYIPSFGASTVFPGKAHYASKVDGEWVVEVVDQDGEYSGLSTSLELDDGDRPHVSFVRIARYEQGFPGSGKLNSLFDVRYARPAQADALNVADAAVPDANAGAASDDGGGAAEDIVVPPGVGQDAGVSDQEPARSGVALPGLMP